MTKKVLVLMSSARAHGNTHALTEEFVRGAQEAGHAVELLMVARMNVKGCLGCRACRMRNGQCVQHDDMDTLYAKLLEADVIAFASPVFFYNVNAQMKLLWDRTFAIEPMLQGKTFCLITTGAAPAGEYYENIIQSFRHYISCFAQSEEGAIVIAGGAADKGDVAKNTPALQRAYEQGKAL